MTDLYREIKRLTDRKKEISRKAGILKYRHVHEGSEEYVELCKEYEEIEAALKVIEQEFPITPFMLEKIVSKYTGKNYKLKSFRETYEDDADIYYSHRFVVCLLDENNKFYNYDKSGKKMYDRARPDEYYDEYCIDTEEFVELTKTLSSTGATGSYELASTFESGFKPILPPSSYLQTINYTKNLTSSFYDNFSNFDFQHIIRDMMKSYFEDIKIDEKSAKQAECGDE